jgi:hypothetical protein
MPSFNPDTCTSTHEGCIKMHQIQVHLLTVDTASSIGSIGSFASWSFVPGRNNNNVSFSGWRFDCANRATVRLSGLSWSVKFKVPRRVSHLQCWICACWILPIKLHASHAAARRFWGFKPSWCRIHHRSSRISFCSQPQDPGSQRPATFASSSHPTFRLHDVSCPQ